MHNSTEPSAAGAGRGVCNCIRTTIPLGPPAEGRPGPSDDDDDDDKNDDDADDDDYDEDGDSENLSVAAKDAQAKVRFLLIWSEARLCWPSLWLPWARCKLGWLVVMRMMTIIIVIMGMMM